MQFLVLTKDSWVPQVGKSTVYLKIDHWNDYSFVTMFHLSFHDAKGALHNIGTTKIGFRGQTTEVSTHQKLPKKFRNLDQKYFSLGQEVDFYRNLSKLSSDERENILCSLRDIVNDQGVIDGLKEEEVFGTSLLRGVSLSVVKGQFARVLNGQPELTDYRFRFTRPETPDIGAISLSFEVTALSKPSTNIHALIGRNGVGKTTLLNGMISTVVESETTSSRMLDFSGWQESPIESDYFSSLVSVSFSAFDPFSPPNEQPDPSKGTCYFYVGLKERGSGKIHRTIDDLHDDCISSLIQCFSSTTKCRRWLDAIEKLNSDENFASMSLEFLKDQFFTIRASQKSEHQSDSSMFFDEYKESVSGYLERMSSGHAIVLLTMTRLVATVEEKTIVLLDEPESHLHPPLLSAFVRSLSDLLHDQNGVAIIATHSPVVLQEIPRSCVWKIYRSGKSTTPGRPSLETFGENVGVLTSEVFGLEVKRSGFHDLLAKSVNTGEDYETLLAEYSGQLGFEGRAILRTLIADRDRGASDAAS